jgi:type 1 glutamine amidotransferase
MKRALIAWGGWEGHQPKECADIVANLLRGEGLAVESENTTSAFVDPDLGRFDLIVPIFSMGTIAKGETLNLSLTVERGTGLAGFHGGMGDSFRLDTAYQFMVGASSSHIPETLFPIESQSRIETTRSPPASTTSSIIPSNIICTSTPVTKFWQLQRSAESIAVGSKGW